MPRSTPSSATPHVRRPVTVLRWPDQDAERRRLAADGRPRVLVTASDVTPDSILDEHELWVRDGDGAEAVLRAVEQLGSPELAVVAGPVLDADGLLRYDGRWVDIPPGLVEVARRLVADYRAPVPEAEVDAAIRRGTGTAASAAHSVIGRLNSRFRTVGLEVERLYRGGYLLAPQAPPDEVE